MVVGGGWSSSLALGPSDHSGLLHTVCILRYTGWTWLGVRCETLTLLLDKA